MGGREQVGSVYVHKRVYVKSLPHSVPIHCYHDKVHVYTDKGRG